jgi:acyl-CoA synthetase (NDP forming)
MNIEVMEYRRIFYPESVAVIGASDNVMKFGGMFMRALMSFGCKARIYPVNPKAGVIMGLPAYASLDAIPGQVDFAVITVPAEQVLEAVKACVKKGVKGAEILTAGFREAGPEGAALERELARTARAGGLRLIGPNCFGLYSPEAGMTLMPGGEFSQEPGPVGFISQSGGGTCDAVYMARGRGVHFSVALSYGNGCDLGAAEMLRYFAADPKTKVVGAYLEGVDDGRDFFEALKVCAAKKPVVILKGGLSEQGYRGTLGHTGSMAGTRVAWNAAIKSAGAVEARDLKDLIELLMAFNCLPGFTGGGAGILAGGGLRTVDGLDAASAYGFTVPPLDDATAAKIQTLLPPAGGKGANPVDLANPVMAPVVVNPIMEMLAARDDIHFLVKYQMIFYLLNSVRDVRKMTGNKEFNLEYHTALTAKAKEIREKTGKPLVMVLLDIASAPEHWDMEIGRWQARAHFTANGIPVFDNGLQAFSVLRRVADYYKRVAGSG